MDEPKLRHVVTVATYANEDTAPLITTSVAVSTLSSEVESTIAVWVVGRLVANEKSIRTQAHMWEDSDGGV